MRTLIDGRSYQAALHSGAMQRPQHKGNRLNAFMEIVHDVTGEQPVISEASLTDDQLKEVDLLIILTRRPAQEFAFNEEEYNGIEKLLSRCGALMLLTNHAPFATNDRQLINRIGEEHEISVFGTSGYQGPCELTGTDIMYHPITEGIERIYFRNSHILSCRAQDNLHVLATIPGLPSPNNVFGIAIEGDGRVVFGADSGFICDESNESDTGYIDRLDNRRYAKQLLEWLCRKR